MHHVDPHGEMFKILEAQMCEFVPGTASPREPARMGLARLHGRAGLGVP
jgi:hypothetical protein